MRLTELDGLRGLFSIMIVFYHLPQSFDINYNNIILDHSYVFVDYFFCLSGFVITMVYSNKIISSKKLKSFIQKRIIRLYPLHLFVLLLYFLGFLIVGYKEGEFYLKFFNSIFLTNSTPLLTIKDGINVPSWSISSEIISYALISVVFLISKTKQTKIFSSIIIIILSILILVFYDIPFFSVSDFGFIRGLIGFNFGVLSYFLYTEYKQKKIKNLELIFPVLMCLVFGVIVKLENTSCLNYTILATAILIPLIMSVSILVIMFSKKTIISNFLNLKYIQKLGLISYSVYLTHSFIFKVFELPLINQYSCYKMFYVVLILTVIMFSTITYNLIEFKLANYLKKLILK